MKLDRNALHRGQGRGMHRRLQASRPAGTDRALAPGKVRRGEHACNCVLNEAGTMRAMGFAFCAVLRGLVGGWEAKKDRAQEMAPGQA
jgi:hypothetical protein